MAGALNGKLLTPTGYNAPLVFKSATANPAAPWPSRWAP